MKLPDKELTTYPALKAFIEGEGITVLNSLCNPMASSRKIDISANKKGGEWWLTLIT